MTLALPAATTQGDDAVAPVSAEYRDLAPAIAMLDSRAFRSMTLLGAPVVPMAGSAPFEYLGSASTRALYVPFAALAPSIARQSERLAKFGGRFQGGIRARGLRRLIIRRLAARVSHQVATGDGLDEHVALPALERRRLRGHR
jgi:hypothetical protein